MTFLARLDSQVSAIAHRRNWFRHANRMTAAINAAYQKPGAKSVSDISRLLETLTPRTTGIELVRLGPNADGGYLVPNDLDGLVGAFSPGVSVEFGFDLDVAGMGIPVYMADASVEEPAGLLNNMAFTPRFLGPKTQNEFVTLEDWVAEYAPVDGELMLEMDIEGAEYDVIETTSTETLNRFRVMVVEYHGLQDLVKPEAFERLKASWAKLAETHTVAHVHINNCAQQLRLERLKLPTVIEVTYLRHDRVTTQEPTLAPVPHPLDELNDVRFPEPSDHSFWQRESALVSS